MNLGLMKTAMLDELQKIAVTRSVKEWRAAQAAGNTGTADQIARASGQLGLAPRYLENVSGGGMEAAVDKMMGRSQMGAGENTSGYVARKIYKPDSPIATGENMGSLLAQKKQMTDTARSLSPEAKNMVPEMYGHQQIAGPGGQIRHISEHEFVPNMSRLRSAPNALEQTQRVQDVVAGPMSQRGMPMMDIARPHSEGKGGIGGNVSNVAMTPQGPKVVDFLPHEFAGGSGGVIPSGPHDLAVSDAGSKRLDTGYGKSNVGQLRRDVYRPQANYQMPALQHPAPAPSPNPATAKTELSQPATVAARKPAVTEAATNVERRMPAPAAATAVAPRSMSSHSMVAPTQMSAGAHAPTMMAKPPVSSFHMPTAASTHVGQGMMGALGKAPAAGLGSLKHTLLMPRR